MQPSVQFGIAEAAIVEAVRWLRLAIETTGAVIIALGVVMSLLAFLRAFVRRRDAAGAGEGYNGVRLTLARYLALALEFQLGADILSTAIAPSWEQIGKLGAIAVIRTALNFFLGREMREEVQRSDVRARAAPDGGTDEEASGEAARHSRVGAG